MIPSYSRAIYLSKGVPMVGLWWRSDHYFSKLRTRRERLSEVHLEHSGARSTT